MQAESYDVMIVGGGMVGSALACALAQKTALRIAVLESQSSSYLWSSDRYHHRVSAISLSSKKIFESLHVWDAMKQKRVSPFSRIQVWDQADKSAIHFDSVDIAEPLLGYIVENNVIQSVLAEKAKTYAQINYVAPIKLQQFNQDDDGVVLTADDGRVFEARLAVAADGANSWLRQQAGIHMETVDYEQHAIVTTIETALPHQKIARQIFLSTGPLAFLPLQEEKLSSLVWSLPKEEADRLLSLDEDVFRAELGAAFGHRLGDIVHLDKRHAFPLAKRQAQTYIAARVALIGDAAHTVHPLAGQGVNMGLLDAASLAEIIIETDKKRRDIGGLVGLRRYERWRRADNMAMLTGVDVIKRLFASDKAAIQCAVGLGLSVTRRAQWLKNMFTRQAVGKREGLPSLAR